VPATKKKADPEKTVLKRLAESFRVTTAPKIEVDTGVRGKDLKAVLEKLEREELVEVQKDNYTTYKLTAKGKKKIEEM
jgi:DNA-binding MarR family transcriptional regulator